MRHRRPAFAIVDFLIIVVILAILAAIAIPQFARQKEKRAAKAVRDDLTALGRAEASYFDQHKQYTTDKGALGFAESPGVVVRIDSASARQWTATAVGRAAADTCVATIDTTTAAMRVSCRGATPR
jgi:Tfp pilus assembly protein PilE